MLIPRIKLRKVKVIALPITRYSHTRLRKPLGGRRVTSPARYSSRCKSAAVKSKERKKEECKKKKKTGSGDKEGLNARRNKKTAHLRIVMLTPARSNNRHQTQWRNPCWKGGREVVEAESKGWGQSRERGTGNVIALSYCGASLPGLALPLRKFLQTKIYTDTTVSTAPPSSLLLPCSFSLLLSTERACETAPSKREAMSPPPTLIFLVSIKIFLENLETKIYHEPLDLRRKSTSVTTDPMRQSVDACLYRIKKPLFLSLHYSKNKLDSYIRRHDSWI